MGPALFALPTERFFRLSETGVRCGPDGLYVGRTPLLARAGVGWAARPRDELEHDLSDLYGLPIDLFSREDRLAAIARAFERDEPALAAIGALLLRFPDPPSLAKGAPARGSLELAQRLFNSGLLKEWDSLKHPRLGGPPNRGQFAVKPPDPSAPPAPARSNAWLTRETFRGALRAARKGLREAAEEVIAAGRWALWLKPDWRLLLEVAIETLDATPLNQGEQQVIDRMRAAQDPPKTLAELQQPPTQNVLGYEQHHIVEQNPDNVAKSPLAARIEKFGQAALDDPSNLVWVPRLKHEQITAYYNALEVAGQPGPLHRDVIGQLDFASQREAGLEALCRYGVLK
jgi:hypothetical protein